MSCSRRAPTWCSPTSTSSPRGSTPTCWTTRLADLHQRLQAHQRLMVAFSGGADSAFLLAAAVRALGADNVTAATAYSDSLPVSERGPAHTFAQSLGVDVLTPRTAEMEREGYRANDGDRCAFCKAELLDVLGPLAVEHGCDAVATGTNADDARAGFRPGIAAAGDRGAVTPLLDAGLTKAQIRTASREWGLPTWDKPAAACLSSRVAYGIEITPARLARVEQAEAGLRAALEEAGVRVGNLRVRDLGRPRPHRGGPRAAWPWPGSTHRWSGRPASRPSRWIRSGSVRAP